MVWQLLGLLVAILVSFSFQPENPRKHFKAQLNSIFYIGQKLDDKARKILDDEVEKNWKPYLLLISGGFFL